MSDSSLIGEVDPRISAEQAVGRTGALLVGHHQRVGNIARLFPLGERRTMFHIWIDASSILNLDQLAAFLVGEGWSDASVSGNVLSVPSQGASWTRAELMTGDYNGALPPLLNDLIDGLAQQGY